MKNILFINHSIRDGGPGRSLYYLLKHFDYEGFNVNVLIPDRKVFSCNIERDKLKVNQIINSNFPENLKRQNFKYKNKPFSILPVDIVVNLFRLIFLMFDLKKDLKRNQIDVIYCNGTLAKFFGAILGSYYSIKVIWHVRNYQKNIFLSFFLNFLSSFSCVKKIICVSESTMSQFRDKNKCIVINNGVDTEEFNPKSVEKKSNRKTAIPNIKILVTYSPKITSKRLKDLLI